MKDVLTTKELALRWSLNPNTLSTWRMKKKGPSFVKIGNWTVVYSLKAVVAYEKRFPFIRARSRKIS